MRRAVIALFTMLLVGFFAAPAMATTIDDVVSSLGSDPVYNDPKAENKLTDAQAQALRDQIGDDPIYIAILPAAAKGTRSSTAVVQYLQQNGNPGTYAAVVGNEFRATNGPAANAAFQAQKNNGVDAVLTAYVSNVQNGVTGSTGSSSESSGGSLLGPVVVIGALAAGAGGLVLMSKRKASKRNEEALAQVRQTLDEDITAFGESLDSVDSDAITTEENRADWMAALDQYDKAKNASAAMRTPAEAATVTEALDEGRFRVACVQARLAGEPLPERRPPCFFDPRHGLSVKDVSYTPAGAVARDVPACAACAAAIEDGLDPQVRMVPAQGGGHAPYWNAGPQYGGYASGYYNNSGMDLFSTILVGTMLGNMMSGGWGGGYVDQSGGGWGDSSGGGFGGGDFGGGFGGGDFGGGGGGDFGGGGGDFGGW